MTTLMPYKNGRSAVPSLFGWDPLRVFDDFLAPSQGEVLWSAAPVNVKHEQDHALISVDMPGVGRCERRAHLRARLARDRRSTGSTQLPLHRRARR